MTLQLQIGLDVIRSYKRLAYTPWYALAEFIDNSTQSYRNNRTTLDRAYKKEQSQLQVQIDYDRHAGLLIVEDNAMGMSHAELAHALHIGKPPADTSGRSQFGLGLKTAACWFGNKWSVRTKKLGEDHGHQIEVDVEAVASGNSQALPTERFSASKSEHYTQIRIEDLNLKLQGRRLGKTKESLASMYRVDIRDGLLELIWDDTPLGWSDRLEFLQYPDGSLAKKAFNFDVGGRVVRGWMGVLAPGSSSRSNAGFALIRRGRLIRGWPDSWRPEAIFGPPPGRNDLINQRFTGEVHLDSFDVTHTKDDILWHENEDDEVQEQIKKSAAPLLQLAREFRHKPTIAVQTSIVRDQSLKIESLLEDSEFGPRLSAAGNKLSVFLKQLAPEDILALAAKGSIKNAVAEAPVMSLSLADGAQIHIHLLRKSKSQEPYILLGEVKKGESALIINVAHPVCSAEEDSEVLKTHIQHAFADGLTIWALARDRVAQAPTSILALKDSILRFVTQA